MREALRLARRGEGLTRPNPPVGAVVVKGGRMIGQGWHRKAGGPHAEIHALRQAGAAARGATLYVTLEPCSTWGRTPPCTDAIVAAGIGRVVVACTDPNPKHAGRGLRLLRRHGISTSGGVAGDEGLTLIEPFAHWIATGRPWVTLKLGVTIDGRIADASGHSKWITGEPARRHVQALRRRADAIMVGWGTVKADDPSLLPRPARGRKPFRVIIGGPGRGTQRIFRDDASGQTITHPRRNGRAVSLGRAVSDLGRRGCLHVLCEGGGHLAASLVRAGLVNEIRLFVAPRMLGADARPALAGRGWPLAKAPKWKFCSAEPIGSDLLLVLRPRR